jgi:hypothetical protein
MYKVGDKVKVSSENDNESYDEFREKTLVITISEVGGRGYDMGVYPQKLMCFETLDGEEIPFSLYEYEIEHA